MDWTVGRGRNSLSRTHLGSDVLVGSRGSEGEADEEHVGLRVGEGPQSVVVLLPRRVPQTQVNWPPVHHYVSRVVVEHSGDVFSWEGIGSVAYEETCLANRSRGKECKSIGIQ